MKKWKIAAEDHGSPYIHGYCYIAAASGYLGKIIGVNNYTLLFQSKDTHWLYCGRVDGKIAEWDELGKIILEKLENPSLLKKVYLGQKESCRLLQEEANRIYAMDLPNKTSKQLCDIYDNLIEKWIWMNAWGDIVNLSDFEHFALTNKIIDFLKSQIRKTNSKLSAGEAFGILGAPIEKSFLQRQEIAFYSVLAKIQKDPAGIKLFSKDLESILLELDRHPAISNLIDSLVLEYDWIQFHYDGPDLANRKYYCDILRSELAQGAIGSKKVLELTKHEENVKKSQNRVQKELKLDKKQIHWTNVAKTFSFLKGLRKDSVFMCSRYSDPLIREFGKRLGLSAKQIRHAKPTELRKWLEDGNADSNLLNERIKLTVIIGDESGVNMYSGKEAEKYSKLIIQEETAKNITELIGTPAYPGKVRGIVRIIEKSSDMAKMNEGDVLVSMATNPNLVPAMKKAAAIITNEGGVTCHAAIVSRELKIPCVIGTKIATKVLKDGDMVEVNANEGIIIIIKSAKTN